jgi:hypothetical protein
MNLLIDVFDAQLFSWEEIDERYDFTRWRIVDAQLFKAVLLGRN